MKPNSNYEHITSSIEEAVTDKGKDVVEGEGNESTIGEQEGDTSGLTDTDTDRRRLIDEFYSQDGLWKFLESEDKDEDKGKVGINKEETKVMTRSEYERQVLFHHLQVKLHTLQTANLVQFLRS